jgi:hypothetical protein
MGDLTFLRYNYRFAGKPLLLADFHGRLLWPTFMTFGRPTSADKSRPRPPALIFTIVSSNVSGRQFKTCQMHKVLSSLKSFGRAELWGQAAREVLGSIQILREPCICTGSGDGDVMSNGMEHQQHHLSSILLFLWCACHNDIKHSIVLLYGYSIVYV